MYYTDLEKIEMYYEKYFYWLKGKFDNSRQNCILVFTRYSGNSEESISKFINEYVCIFEGKRTNKNNIQFIAMAKALGTFLGVDVKVKDSRITMQTPVSFNGLVIEMKKGV